jgi:uncharacterized protein (TIGR02466 family)
MNEQTQAQEVLPETGKSPVQLKKFEPLFASPVFTYEVAGFEALNRGLLSDIEGLRAVSQGIKRSNQHGWHSDVDFFRRPEKSFRYLQQCIGRVVVSSTKKVSPGLGLKGMRLDMQGWINVNFKGAYNTPHDHPGYMWSGCYYVKIPKAKSGRSGDIEFLDPRTNVQNFGVPESAHFSPKIRIVPREGMLLLFPAYLRHWVYPNEEDAERVSIAFNARLSITPSPDTGSPKR